MVNSFKFNNVGYITILIIKFCLKFIKVLLKGILDGILNEIAPSALLPRNDGILEFSVIPQLDWGISIEILNLFVMRSPEGVGG